MPNAAIRIAVLADMGHVNVRGDPNDTAFAIAVEGVLEQPLPMAANTFTEGKYSIYWLGPDEFQIDCDVDQTSKICLRLREAIRGSHFAVNDLTAGQIAIRLYGKTVPELLAKGCTLDLHPSKFPPGACAQSGLGKASVLIANRQADREFDVIVRRSYSDYMIKWLTHAAAD